MATREHQSSVVRRTLLFGGVILVTTAVATILLIWCAAQPARVTSNSIYVEKLKTAHHCESSFPAQRQTVDLFHKAGLQRAALNAIGEEPREVGGMVGGKPVVVFAMLSHLGGLGEIIWVDEWTNFPVKLPATTGPGSVVVPRRAAVQAALKAVEASGGSLIKAGENRCMVAKLSEKEKYEAAIRVLGWLEGKPAPWEPEDKANKSKAESGR
jgi:hypothetical protein